MLLGTFEGRVDAQGRIVVPQKFRDAVQGGMVLARGADGCIVVYPPVEWSEEAGRVARFSRYDRNARLMQRLTFSGAFEATPDRQGRVVVPPNLRSFAGLDVNQPIVIAGQNSYFEVWSAVGWDEQLGQLQNLSDIAESLERNSVQS